MKVEVAIAIVLIITVLAGIIYLSTQPKYDIVEKEKLRTTIINLSKERDDLLKDKKSAYMSVDSLLTAVITYQLIGRYVIRGDTLIASEKTELAINGDELSNKLYELLKKLRH